MHGVIAPAAVSSGARTFSGVHCMSSLLAALDGFFHIRTQLKHSQRLLLSRAESSTTARKMDTACE